MELSFDKLRNWVRLCEMRLELAHTSGHCTAEDIAELVERVRPKRVVPVHTEHPELFRGLADNVLEVEAGRRYAL